MIFKPLFGSFGWLLPAVLASLDFGVWLRRQPAQRRQWRRLLMIWLLCLMLLRPCLAGGTSPSGLTNTDVLFLVDTTNSMTAEDYNGSAPRLDGVKQDIKNLTSQLSGARFAMIIFDAQAHLVLPFTSDTTAVTTQANVLTTEVSLYSQGSSVDLPTELAKKQLSSAKHDHPERNRLVFYLGDGEQTADNPPKSMASLHPLISGGAVLGYGTTAGGKMKEQTSYDTKAPDQYIVDPNTGREALSKIDETTLSTLAKQIGLTYIHRATPQKLDSLVKQLPKGKVGQTHKNTANATDLYWLLAIVLGGLLLIDLRRIYSRVAEVKGSGYA